MRTGQFAVALSSISYLGISGFGIQMGSKSEFAQLVVLIVGLCCMAAGVWLAMVRERHQHVEVPHETPTKGDREFLAYITPLLPFTIADVSKHKFPYDDNKTKPELLLGIRYKRLGFQIRQDTIYRDGDTFRLKGDSGGDDSTVIFTTK